MIGGEESIPEMRPVVYCLLPPDLAPRLHELLRRHFRDGGNDAVEVIVEQRRVDRREPVDRRGRPGATPGVERRLINAVAGRRVGERRAPLVAIEASALPRRARRFAARIVFAERLEPSTQQLEDLDTARVVVRIQAGERELFTTLYARYFDRVYSYLRALLRDPVEAEDATQQVFLSVLEALPRYELRAQPFRSWLFVVVRNRALKQIDRSRRLEPLDPLDVARRRESSGLAEDEVGVLDWLSDRELMLFVERLPLLQRQVLLLRYSFDLPAPEIARILGRSPTYVRKLDERALGYLRVRLTALGRAPRYERRRELRGVVRQVRVLRARRWALMP